MAISLDDALKISDKVSVNPGQSFNPSFIQKQPTVTQTIQQKATQAGKAGLGFVGDILNKPSAITESFLTGGKGYEKTLSNAGVTNPTAQKVLGFTGRMVLDPLNLISFGSEGVAKVGLKSLTSQAAKDIGETAFRKLTQMGGKEAAITLSKEAGLKLAKLEPKIGRAAAEAQILKEIAGGAEHYVAKSGVKIGAFGKDVVLPLPKANIKSKVANVIPQGVKDVAGKVALKARQAFEYPLNRAPAGASDIVDAATAAKQKYFEMADKFVQSYTKASPEVKQLADSVLTGAAKITTHENPIVKSAIEMRSTIDDLGKKAVDLGLLDKNTYDAGQGTYLPQLYDVFLQKGDNVLEGAPSAKKIAADEAGRLRTRTESQIAQDLGAGKITQEQAQAEREVLARFKQAGGQVESPAFQASKAVQNLGGLITKEQQFKDLGQFSKTAEDIAPSLVKGDSQVALEKGIHGTQNSEIERRALDVLARASASGKTVESEKAIQEGAKQLLQRSTQVTHEGQKLYKLPESASLGALSGTFVPEAIHTYLTEGSGRLLSSNVGKWMMRLSAPFNFKTMKTVYSPGSQVRNVISNQILGFMNDPGSFKHFKQAIDVVSHPNSKEFQEMEKVGLFNGKFFGEEVKRFYKSIETKDDITTFSKFVEGLKNFGGAIHNKLGDAREVMESHAKIQQYLRARSLGASAEQAKRVAEKTLFAYNKVGPGVRILRSTGVPFITFTLKAAPFIAETGLKNPKRLAVFPKLEREMANLFNDHPEDEKYMPTWMKGMIPMPGTDENGNKQYFNPRYLYPWGSIVGDFNPLPGLPFIGKGGTLPGGVSMSPTISEGISQVTGRDLFTGQEFVNDAMLPGDAVKARLTRIGKTFSPGPVSSALPFLTGSQTDAQSQKGLGNSILGSMTGLQTQPFNLANGMDQQSKAIQAIQRETTTEVNKALKEGKSFDYIRHIQERGFERIQELQ